MPTVSRHPQSGLQCCEDAVLSTSHAVLTTNHVRLSTSRAGLSIKHVGLSTSLSASLAVLNTS